MAIFARSSDIFGHMVRRKGRMLPALSAKGKPGKVGYQYATGHFSELWAFLGLRFCRPVFSVVKKKVRKDLHG
jgi:hypothetical protein